MRSVRWARVAPALLPLAVLVALLNPVPAFAAEMAAATGTLSAYSSGDVAKWKVAAERDAGTLKWRAVVTVWCDNSNGAAVNCGLIEGTNVITELTKSGGTVQEYSAWNDAANVHSKRFEHAWECEQTWLGQYQAGGYFLQATSRFGEPGTPKDRFSGFTALAGSC